MLMVCFCHVRAATTGNAGSEAGAGSSLPLLLASVSAFGGSHGSAAVSVGVLSSGWTASLAIADHLSVLVNLQPLLLRLDCLVLLLTMFSRFFFGCSCLLIYDGYVADV